MFKDEILENERRRKIYAAIERSPGIHLRELQRMLSMPLTTLEYHLSYMARKKILFAETQSHHKRGSVKLSVDESPCQKSVDNCFRLFRKKAELKWSLSKIGSRTKGNENTAYEEANCRKR